MSDWLDELEKEVKVYSKEVPEGYKTVAEIAKKMDLSISQTNCLMNKALRGGLADRVQVKAPRARSVCGAFRVKDDKVKEFQQLFSGRR